MAAGFSSVARKFEVTNLGLGSRESRVSRHCPDQPAALFSAVRKRSMDRDPRRPQIRRLPDARRIDPGVSSCDRGPIIEKSVFHVGLERIL